MRFTQLFHRLRHTKDCASSAGWTHNLGHFDNLLGNREVERCKNVPSCSTICGTNHLEHWNHQNWVNDLLHGVPQYLLLQQASVLAAPRLVPPQRPSRRPSHSTWPPAAWGGEGRRGHALARGRVVHLAALPWPWLSSGPVGRYGASLQPGHGDAHPCIPQICTEASLTPPSGGSCGVVNTSHGVDH